MFHRMVTVEPATVDAGASVQCFVCGGFWERLEDGDTVSVWGHPATDCTGDSGQYHHFPGECSCPGECVADPNCNCLACDS